MDMDRDMNVARVIVVTPVYEDREASTRLFAELAQSLGDSVHVVAVDDGSLRQPVEASAIARAGVSGTVLRLRRNVGHQRAIAIGLAYVAERLSDEQRVVVMDSDGEDLPSSIAELLQPLDASEDIDVAVARRKSRVETFKFKAFYAVYKRVFQLLTGRAISFGNFMALRASAVRRLVAMHELPVHVAGCVIASRLRAHVCHIARGPRYAGQSKMNFVGLVLHGFKGMMVFAEDVVVRVGIACSVVAGMAIALAAMAVALRVLGYSSPGWFSVALGILVIMFFQMSALALMTLMQSSNKNGYVVPLRTHLELIAEALDVLPAHAMAPAQEMAGSHVTQGPGSIRPAA
ncbi:glycosyltransferase [Hydrogenophaga sp. 5NK40-0174]|uniref:glycosyltransferase n=1 Tax=Hydrogenophaga sp. 5NK40-0174 TaxID=3127649 RepID=UPI003340E6FA